VNAAIPRRVCGVCSAGADSGTVRCWDRDQDAVRICSVCIAK